MTYVRTDIPSEARMAIAAFLNCCQTEAQPFATVEALGAIRTIFPGMNISDVDLKDAISAEAVMAGFDADYRSGGDKADNSRRRALERWENEGGAVVKLIRTEAQRQMDNDTVGARRRSREMKDRNQLI